MSVIKATAERTKKAAARVLGSKIEARRLALGLNQTDLAAKAGLKQGVLSMMENGERYVTFYTAQLLADALKCTLEDLRISITEIEHAANEIQFANVPTPHQRS